MVIVGDIMGNEFLEMFNDMDMDFDISGFDLSIEEDDELEKQQKQDGKRKGDIVGW